MEVAVPAEIDGLPAVQEDAVARRLCSHNLSEEIGILDLPSLGGRDRRLHPSAKDSTGTAGASASGMGSSWVVPSTP